MQGIGPLVYLMYFFLYFVKNIWDSRHNQIPQMDSDGQGRAWRTKTRLKNLLIWIAVTGRRVTERNMLPKNLLKKKKMLALE